MGENAGKEAGLRVLVVHGPNLNLLGDREVSVYGTASLADIDTQLADLASELDVEVDTFQSNSEGDIVSAIQDARSSSAGLLINPAAYTHTSVAIRDAVIAAEMPVVEVHMSNIHRREEFRHKSLLADIVIGQVLGFGAASYLLGLRALVGFIRDN